MRYYASLFLLFTALSPLSAQVKKLHHGLNRDHTNNFHPKLSPDGRYMIYFSDLEDPKRNIQVWESKYMGKERWTSPEVLDNTINLGTVNSVGGFSLSYDQQSMYLASQRYGGVGYFDIWVSERGGDSWKKPVNFGKPLNSEMHDGDPSISPDGEELYFCRCKNMSRTSASGCTIMVAERRGSGFGEPKELPAKINTGNAMAPLILADNQTLIFASDKPGGKGGLDLYLTRKTSSGWSDPVALDYINDATDNRYLSIPAQGDIAYYSKQMDGNEVLVKAIIPEKYRQKKLLWLMINAEGGEGYDPLVEVINRTTGKESYHKPAADGSLSLFLAEGALYDISIRDKKGKYDFQSKLFDLTSLDDNKGEKWTYSAKSLKKGSELALRNINVDLRKTDPASQAELDRIFYILKNNDGLNAEVQVCLTEYKEDSTASDPSLTETRMDTTMEITAATDSTEADTVQLVTTIYHNDFTPDYAGGLQKYADSKGIPKNRFTVVSHSKGCKIPAAEGMDNRQAVAVLRMK